MGECVCYFVYLYQGASNVRCIGSSLQPMLPSTNPCHSYTGGSYAHPDFVFEWVKPGWSSNLRPDSQPYHARLYPLHAASALDDVVHLLKL